MEGSLFMFAVLIDIILAFYAGYLSYSAVDKRENYQDLCLQF